MDMALTALALGCLGALIFKFVFRNDTAAGYCFLVAALALMVLLFDFATEQGINNLLGWQNGQQNASSGMVDWN